MRDDIFLPSYYYADVSGTSELSLPRSAGESLRDYKIYGNSVQDGTPTPDEPVEVEDVGEKVEIIEENLENLFEYGTLDDYNPKGHLMSIGDNSLTAYILSGASSCFYKSTYYPAGTYTISMTSSNTSCRFLIRLYNNGSIVTNTSELNGFAYNAGYQGFYKDVSGSTASMTFTTSYEWRFGSVFMGTTGNYCTISNIKILDVSPKYKVPIIARGKNLVNIKSITVPNATKNVTDNGITGTNTAKSYFYIPITVKKNTDYTFRFRFNVSRSSGEPFGVGYNWSPDGNYFAGCNSSRSNYAINTDNYWKCTFNSSNYTTIYFKGYIAYNSNTVSFDFWDIQLEEGKTATEYEPYVEPITTNMYLDKPLRKVGTRADYIDFKNSKVVRRIYKRAFVGTEDWSGPWAGSVTNNSAGFYLYFNRITTKSIVGWNGFSNRGECVYYNSFAPTSPNQLGRCWIHNVGAYLAYHPPCTTLADFKAWLAEKNAEGNPFYVYFGIANEEEDIDLSNLPTFKGTTIYEVGTSINPSNIELQYYRY